MLVSLLRFDIYYERWYIDVRIDAREVPGPAPATTTKETSRADNDIRK